MVMPKNKIRSKAINKNYFLISLGIFLIILCLLIIGRVGSLNFLFLLLSIIFGDFTILVLLFTLFFCVYCLILNKKIDFHHIYFIGFIFLFIGLSLLAHLGLFDSLAMSKNNVISKTIGLYTRYFKSYQHGYSCGGGIVIALIMQLICLISGKIGVILVATGCIIASICFIIDINILKLFKGGKITKAPMKILSNIKKYFKGIHYPKSKNEESDVSISILKDTTDSSSFILQEEINKERLIKLKEYINKNHIYCVCNEFNTSYTSSRYTLKLANKADSSLKDISDFFNRACFIIKNDLTATVEIPNQFKKLLTLKEILINSNDNIIPLFTEINNEAIAINTNIGSSLFILGDQGSGIKTFIRSMLSAILIKKYKPKNIYFYDLYNEYQILSNSKINYINNEKSALLSFDTAFNEYERRCEAIKYLGVDNIIDANKKIIDMGNEYEKLEPIFHFIFLNNNILNPEFIQRLSYVIQFGIKVGMIIIVICKDKGILSKINIANSSILCFYINDVATSIKLFGADIACRLQKKGDVLYQSKNKIYHGQAPYISLDDFENVINHI